MSLSMMMRLKYNRMTGCGWKWHPDDKEWVLYEDDFEMRRADLAPWEEEEVWIGMVE